MVIVLQEGKLNADKFCFYSSLTAKIQRTKRYRPPVISLLHFSSGFAPQMLQTFFFTRILMAIPAKASPRSTMERMTTAMFKFTQSQV
jgi:hypothetical protein